MKYEIKILLNIIKQAMNLDEIYLNDLDKLNLIITILELNKETKIEKIGNGTYSNVYMIGNKVLKIGLAKLDLRIIRHPSIINVYLKTNLLIESNNMPITVGIEVQEFAETSSPNENELYALYKKLRDDGIIWHDIKPSNTGYNNNQLVVIDTDFLCYVNETSNYLDNIDIKFDALYNDSKEESNGL